MRIVIDTNVIVSALLVPSSLPANVFQKVTNRSVLLLYNNSILVEYIEVLYREKLKINKEILKDVFEFINKEGIFILAEPINTKFTDETDKKFYEVYKSGHADYLITGNKKHFPKEKGIVTPSEFLNSYFS